MDPNQYPVVPYPAQFPIDPPVQKFKNKVWKNPDNKEYQQQQLQQELQTSNYALTSHPEDPSNYENGFQNPQYPANQPFYEPDESYEYHQNFSQDPNYQQPILQPPQVTADQYYQQDAFIPTIVQEQFEIKKQLSSSQNTPLVIKTPQITEIYNPFKDKKRNLTKEMEEHNLKREAEEAEKKKKNNILEQSKAKDETSQQIHQPAALENQRVNSNMVLKRLETKKINKIFDEDDSEEEEGEGDGKKQTEKKLLEIKKERENLLKKERELRLLESKFKPILKSDEKRLEEERAKREREKRELERKEYETKREEERSKKRSKSGHEDSSRSSRNSDSRGDDYYSQRRSSRSRDRYYDDRSRDRYSRR
ncbi:hypothetical protein HDU92_007905 [Lobulomyces angularis]|nr:hypothetical protein HDU92_007905 [Lobulomyces angularis]